MYEGNHERPNGLRKCRAPLCATRVQLVCVITVLLRLIAVIPGGQVPQAAHVAGPGRGPTPGGALGGEKAAEGAETGRGCGGARFSWGRTSALSLCARWGSWRQPLDRLGRIATFGRAVDWPNTQIDAS